MRVYDCENCDWIAEPDVMPVEKQEPTLFDEAGTNNQPMSNIV